MKKRIFVALLVGVMALSLAACSNSSTKNNASNSTKITLSCMAFNKEEIQAGVSALESLGYDVDVVILQDATTMCQAVMTNELEAALHPHQPWIDSYNAGNNANVMMLTPYIHKNVFGIFSDKYNSVDEIPDGATIVFPQDEANMSRSLLFLQSLGLITLRDGVTSPSDLDIKDNPKKFKFDKIAVAQVVSAIPDVAAVCSAKMWFVGNNLPQNYEICTSDDLDKFGVGFIINPDRANEQWVSDLMSVYTSEDQRAAINDIFKGAYVPGF